MSDGYYLFDVPSQNNNRKLCTNHCIEPLWDSASSAKVYLQFLPYPYSTTIDIVVKGCWGANWANWRPTKIERRQLGYEPKNKAIFRL